MTPSGIEHATFRLAAQCPQNTIRTDWIRPTPCKAQQMPLKTQVSEGCLCVTGYFPEFEDKTVRNTGKHKCNVISQDKRNPNRITVETSYVARVTSARVRNQTSILQLFQPIA